MIEILPQHVANQIAAGEVVQRPASIVKELLENSVDAGAMSITLKIQDGGQTLIQVIDNGVGMSEEDAVKAFMRHATSKIRKAEDLFNLHTFGFRGEALASIASVSEVEMKTCRAQDSIGVQVNINGGSKPVLTPVSTSRGTNLSVRNLFFNTPARRKFLKSVAAENKQIITEFQRVALVNPDIEFQLIVNEKPILRLASGNLHQRIVGITNKTLGSRLLSIESDTAFAKISGYIGTPAASRKQAGEQFFFVNGRFMRNPYLQKAIVNGYGKLLTADQYPTFFIYIEVDPSKLDVNIHPTKSEVKFEDEHAIWQVLSSCVRQTLGKHNIVPVLDFENETQIEIPTYNKTREDFSMPVATRVSSGYNPFKSYNSDAWEKPAEKPTWGEDPELAPFTEQIPDYLKTIEAGGFGNLNAKSSVSQVVSGGKNSDGGDLSENSYKSSTNLEGFSGMNPVADSMEGGDSTQDNQTEFGSVLSEGFGGDSNGSGRGLPHFSGDSDGSSRGLPHFGGDSNEFDSRGTSEFDSIQKELPMTVETSFNSLQWGGRYVITTTADGVIIIDYPRAMQRIAYEKILANDHFTAHSQGELHPQAIELSALDHRLMMDSEGDIAELGFRIGDMGGTTVALQALPAELAGKVSPEEAIEALIKGLNNPDKNNRRENLAKLITRNIGRTTPRILRPSEISTLLSELLATDEPSYTPDQLPIIEIINPKELFKR